MSDFTKLQEAVAFAARAHRHQLRKDRETPYVSHVFRVCLVARHVFGIDDLKVLTAAVLHDTIEDTTTDFDDLEEHFGAEVAGWVALLSKDKRLSDPEREKQYKAGLAAAPWQVKVCKLADVYDNLSDNKTPGQQQRSLKRAQDYLEALRPGLPEEARKPFEIVWDLYEKVKKAPA